LRIGKNHILEVILELAVFPSSYLFWSFIMIAIRILSAAFLSLAALAVHAQQNVAPQPAPVDSVTKSVDCAANKTARHDHGIERGYGPMPTKACGNMTETKVADKASTRHDHSKFHKNQ
jgi:hypothetical protein